MGLNDGAEESMIIVKIKSGMSNGGVERAEDREEDGA